MLLEYGWLVNMARTAGPAVLSAAGRLGSGAQKFVKYLWKKAKNIGADPKDAGKAAGKGAGGKVIDIATGTAVGGAAGGAASALGTAGAAALGGGAGGFFGSEQDVNIDDITTDKALNIKSKEMEKLLKTTNKAVQDMNKLLSQTQKMLLKSFDSMESSMDDMVAVQTGETSGQVDARQNMGGTPSSRRKKDKKQKQDQDSPLEKRKKIFPGAEV